MSEEPMFRLAKDAPLLLSLAFNAGVPLTDDTCVRVSPFAFFNVAAAAGAQKLDVNTYGESGGIYWLGVFWLAIGGLDGVGTACVKGCAVVHEPTTTAFEFCLDDTAGTAHV